MKAFQTLSVSLSLAYFLLASVVHSVGEPRTNRPSTKNTFRCPEKWWPGGEWKEKLVIHHIYVGQGDSTFIRTPSGTTLLIDAGLPGQGKAQILPLLKNCYRLNSLDYIIITHPHTDHFGGLVDLISNAAETPALSLGVLFDTGDLFEGSPGNPPKAFKNYLKVAQKLTRKVPDLGTETFKSRNREVSFSVMAVNGKIFSGSPDAVEVQTLRPNGTLIDANAVSIALTIKYKNFDYFIGGDLTGNGDGKSPDVESALAPFMGQVDVYHASHHGSLTSSTQAFLDRLSPKQIIISVGKGGVNSAFYHLPSEQAIQRMHSMASVKSIFMTSKGEGPIVPPSKDHPKLFDLDGDILVVTDGSDYTINSERTFSAE